MTHWWQGLNLRERRIFLSGAVLSLSLLLYALAWHPFQTRLTDLRRTVAAQRADLTWMQQAAQEVKRLSSADPAPTQQGGPSLPTLVDQSARSEGLGSALKRVEPQSDGNLRVRLEQVGFDQMIRWLNKLEREHRVSTVNAVVDRQDHNGLVNARLLLQGETP